MSKLTEQMQKLTLDTQEADKLGLSYGEYMIMKETAALPRKATLTAIRNHYYEHGTKRRGGMRTALNLKVM